MQLRDLFDQIPVTKEKVSAIALAQLLQQELDLANNWERAEQLLLQARDQFPEHLEIPMALYKLYAYSNRFDESLALINEVLLQSATLAGFSADWRSLHSASAPWNPAQGNVRIYLYTLKASGFVRLRQGDSKVSYDALSKLCELDPQDQVGGSVVYEMAVKIKEDLSA